MVLRGRPGLPCLLSPEAGQRTLPNIGDLIDDGAKRVTVQAIAHRRDTYRT